MIIIDDLDSPVQAAAKIIHGTRPVDLSLVEKRLRACLMPDSIKDDDTMDMYELDEIKEIADYLMVYYNAHCMEGD